MLYLRIIADGCVLALWASVLGALAEMIGVRSLRLQGMSTFTWSLEHGDFTCNSEADLIGH